MKGQLAVVADKPGRAGFGQSESKLLDRMLMSAGVARSDAAIIWPDDWQDGMEKEFAAVVLAGEVAATEVLKWFASPGDYHGSILPGGALPPASFHSYQQWCNAAPKFVITFGIDKLHKQYSWHPLAKRDWQKAGMVLRGEVPEHNPMKRDWVLDAGQRLHELADVDMFAFDTELTPEWMFGAATADKVYVTSWGRDCRLALEAAMGDERIVKVAHNLQHDLAMCELKFDLRVKPAWFDTMGGAHLLNTGLEKSLSPGVSARFTFWPYHKWLAGVDAQRYNGMDNVVCYDGYWEIVKQLKARDLWQTAVDDHELLEVLFEMQHRGLAVDVKERAAYEVRAKKDVAGKDRECQRLMRPIIRTKLERFKKPHLFTKTRKCPCCGGGKLQAMHCAKCGGLSAKPRLKSDFPTDFAPGVKRTMKDLKASLPSCRMCGTAGKRDSWRAINPGSDDAVADVVYRGLGIAPRRYKGKETVKAEQLEKIKDRHPVIAALVTASEARADLSTVERLTPDPLSGKLHSVFDPWGTASGRVASKEGLLRAGTNLMNIPKAARRFIVPAEGYTFLYPDMAQVEARAVAVLCRPWGDNFFNAFLEPIDWPGHERHGTIDSHTRLQQLVSRWIEISRDQAKRVIYAVMYGAQAAQLAIELTAEAFRKKTGGIVSEQHAEAIIAAVYKAFPEILQWQQSIVVELERNRCLRSPSGRERHWPERIMTPVTKRNPVPEVKRDVVKAGWSFKPQEIGAKVLAAGLKEIAQKHSGLLEVLVHVHDAGLMQAKTSRLEEAKQAATSALSRTMFDMWFPCDMKVGRNWYECS